MPNDYGGGLDTGDEGELNWRGRPKCTHSGAGVNCYHTHSGSPSTNPNGGHGCKQNFGTGWSGPFYWVMSDTYGDRFMTEYVSA